MMGRKADGLPGLACGGDGDSVLTAWLYTKHPRVRWVEEIQQV